MFLGMHRELSTRFRSINKIARVENHPPDKARMARWRGVHVLGAFIGDIFRETETYKITGIDFIALAMVEVLR